MPFKLQNLMIEELREESLTLIYIARPSKILAGPMEKRSELLIKGLVLLHDVFHMCLDKFRRTCYFQVRAA